jgi:AAA15 family ATPase/GTPase
LIAEEHLRRNKDRADLSETKIQFFSLYEYDDEDIEIFDELLELITKYERPTPEIRLYERIFERAFKIDAPEVLYHMMEFESLFVNSFNKSFLPHFLERLRISSESRRPAIGGL